MRQSDCLHYNYKYSVSIALQHQFTVPIHKLRHLLTESRSSTSLPPAAGHNATSEDTATGSATLLTHSDCLWLAIVIAVCTCIVLLVTAVGALAFAAYFCYTCKTTEQVTRVSSRYLKRCCALIMITVTALIITMACRHRLCAVPAVMIVIK